MDEKLKSQIMQSHAHARPVTWFGTGLSQFDEGGKPQASRGYGLGTLSMLFKSAQLSDKVTHIIGDCADGYGIPEADRDRLVSDRLRIDEIIAKRLGDLKTVDGRTISLSTLVASDLDKQFEAEAVRQLVTETLCKFDGVPNFAKRKLYVGRQCQWETQLYMNGGSTKVGWELPNKAEFYRNAPLEHLVQSEFWNEVTFFRVLEDVMRQIDPNFDVKLVNVAGEPDMKTGKIKSPYSSLPSHVSPLMMEPFDKFMEEHCDVGDSERRRVFRKFYDKQVVGNFETVYGELGGKNTSEKMREIQGISLGI
ncbi:MAG: hypothetical protein FWE16_05415 [Firmicutes bacterium]|nr:hypothetical protein [Bacillota bacterium]